MDAETRAQIETAIATASPDVAAAVRALVERAVACDERRAALPCQTAVPSPTACESANTCEFAGYANVCPLRGHLWNVDATEERLIAAGVPLQERRLLLAHARGVAALRPTWAISAIKAWVAGDRREFDVAPAKGIVRGDERLVVLAGPPGVGKTLAACYALARRGGVYVRAYAFASVDGVNLDAVKAQRRVVVIDQLDFDGAGVPPYAAQQLRDVIDARYAEVRPTILCANMPRPEFDRIFGATMADRLAGGGTWIALEGRSQRKELAP